MDDGAGISAGEQTTPPEQAGPGAVAAFAADGGREQGAGEVRATEEDVRPAEHAAPGTEDATAPQQAPASQHATAAERPPASEQAGAPGHAAAPVAAATPEPSAPTALPAGEEERSPGFRERGRMRRRLAFLRRARELAYRDLGGLVFNLHRYGRRNDELVLAKLGVLERLDTELRALERALRDRRPTSVLRVAGMTACPRCAAIHASEDRFCPNCGLPMGRHPDLPIAGPPAQAPAPAPAPGPPHAAAGTAPHVREEPRAARPGEDTEILRPPLQAP